MSGTGVETVEYQQESETVRTQFDQEKTPASMAVIATLADMMDADPCEIDSLYSTVDPDALDAFVPVRNGTNADTHVTFTHERNTITAYSYDMITITSEHESVVETHERSSEQ